VVEGLMKRKRRLMKEDNEGKDAAIEGEERREGGGT